VAFFVFGTVQEHHLKVIDGANNL
jgi:hypothetical protein